jgi:hypothetical protein
MDEDRTAAKLPPSLHDVNEVPMLRDLVQHWQIKCARVKGERDAAIALLRQALEADTLAMRGYPDEWADQVRKLLRPAPCPCELRGLPEGYVCGDPECPRTKAANESLRKLAEHFKQPTQHVAPSERDPHKDPAD